MWTRGRSAKQIAFDLFVLSAAYGAGCLLLFVLGLGVSSYRGWLVLAAPWISWLVIRTISDVRVSVELTATELVYLGRSARRDFEVALDAICDQRRDPARTHVLVLRLVDGDERVLSDLSPDVAERVSDRLRDLGVVLASADS